MQKSATVHGVDTAAMAMNAIDHRDLEVAPVLLELRLYPVVASDITQHQYPPMDVGNTTSPDLLPWGSKKKRSTPPAKSHTPAPPPLDSPVSPLSFSHSESDNKCCNHSVEKIRDSPFERKRQEWVNKREDMSDQNKQLKRQLEIVNQFYFSQKDLNIQLKSMKLQREDQYRQRELITVNHQPSIFDQTVGNHYGHLLAAKTASHAWSVGGMMGEINSSARDKVGPPLDIDLNVPAPESLVDVETTQPLDGGGVVVEDNVWWNKTKEAVAAAEARQRRKEICRAKMIGSVSSSSSSNNSCNKILLSHAHR